MKANNNRWQVPSHLRTKYELFLQQEDSRSGGAFAGTLPGEAQMHYSRPNGAELAASGLLRTAWFTDGIQRSAVDLHLLDSLALSSAFREGSMDVVVTSPPFTA